LEQFYRPDFIARFPGAAGQRMPAWRVYPDPIAMQALLLQNGHLASRMSTWAHWSAAKGLVYRYPLTDRRLLRFTMGLPPELLWSQGQARGLYRDALGNLLPRQLGKNDHVNEKKRMNIRCECWQLLAREAAKGRYQQGCDWLDMPALQARLRDAPEQMTSTREMLRFLPLCSALQAWHLWQRYF
jgi:asparagine synthase (glutamine-hydrolysing)